MNTSISKAFMRCSAILLAIFSLILFSSNSLDAQSSSCVYASDPNFSVTSGVTTLEVHGDQCFTMDDKLIVTCIDNYNEPSRDTFNYVSCDAATARSSSQRTLTISEFSAEVDLSGCSAVEVLFPDGSVGYYEVLADEIPEPGTDFSGFLNNQYCEDECLIFSVVDAWGALVGTVQGQPCCIDGNIIFTETCADCVNMGGMCDPEPGECEAESYGSVDFGCVEIDRSSTRTFYVKSCPFVEDERRPRRVNGEGDLNTGIIECYYPDIDNLFDNRQALAVDHCEIIIYDIKIHAEHLDDMVVKNGPGELPFSLVGNFEFPINLKRGDNLPFQIQFAPDSYGYEEAVVTICYELSDECECDRFNPDRNQDNTRDGLHCETTKWYDFRVYGEGKDAEEIEGNGECRLKCPECIYTPDAIQVNGDVGGGPCGGYFEYTIGYADAGPPMEDPVGRNGFSCGDLYLDTDASQLYVYDEGAGVPERLPEQQGWIPTPPAPYGLSSLELECNQDARFRLPYIPYLFFDEVDSEMYLVPGYGQPVEQVDIIVSLEQDNIVTRNGGYANCGDYEPGDVFYITPDDMAVRQNAVGEPIAYEFIACDGYRLFAKLVDDMSEPMLSCSFYAEFPGTFSLGYYESYSNGGPFREGCYSWMLDDCEPIPDLLSSNMDENLDGELEVIDPCSCSDPDNVYAGPDGTISLFHDFISVGGIFIDDNFDIEVEITEGELYDMNNVPLMRLGENNRIQLNWDPVRGTHFLEFWTQPGVGFGGQIYVNGIPSTDPDATLLSICDGPCALIPTIGEWGIIILSMMLLILGLVGLRQPKLKLQRIRN
jgi:hypothetical protein